MLLNQRLCLFALTIDYKDFIQIGQTVLAAAFILTELVHKFVQNLYNIFLIVEVLFNNMALKSKKEHFLFQGKRPIVE